MIDWIKFSSVTKISTPKGADLGLRGVGVFLLTLHCSAVFLLLLPSIGFSGDVGDNGRFPVLIPGGNGTIVERGTEHNNKTPRGLKL